MISNPTTVAVRHPTIALTQPRIAIKGRRFRNPELEAPPGVSNFRKKLGKGIKSISAVDGVDDSARGIVSGFPANMQPIASLAGQTIGAALVAPAAAGAVLNSRDKFEAYRKVRSDLVNQQKALLLAFEDEQRPLGVLIELHDAAANCRKLEQSDRWQKAKSRARLDESGFGASSARFAELARSLTDANSPPSTVHRALEYQRLEKMRSIANMERIASLGNAGGMISMTGGLLMGAGQSGTKVAAQHLPGAAAKATATAAGNTIGMATNGVFAAGQLMQALFGASRVMSGTQCHAMLQAELDALARVKDQLDADTYDSVRQTVQRLLELNKLIYVRSGALLGIGQMLMVGGSIASLVAGPATLGVAAVPGTVLSVTGTVFTLAGVAGQVRGDVRKEKFSGEPSKYARQTIEQRDLARAIDRCGLAEMFSEVAKLLRDYQNEVVDLKTLSLARQATHGEKRAFFAKPATGSAREARLQTQADTFGAFRNRTTLLRSDKAQLTRAREALGAEFFEGSREDVEARIHAALLDMPEAKALHADHAFQRIVMYHTLHTLRSSRDPEIRAAFGMDERGYVRDVSLPMLNAIGRRLPQVRAEYIRQTNRLLLPRLRSDVKALRLDTAQRLTRLAEAMVEVNRLADLERQRGLRGDVASASSGARRGTGSDVSWLSDDDAQTPATTPTPTPSIERRSPIGSRSTGGGAGDASDDNDIGGSTTHSTVSTPSSRRSTATGVASSLRHGDRLITHF